MRCHHTLDAPVPRRIISADRYKSRNSRVQALPAHAQARESGVDRLPHLGSRGEELQDTAGAQAPQVRCFGDFVLSHPNTAPSSSSRILRPREVFQRVGLSRTAVYDAARQGKFPRPIKLTERATGWLESEVDAWIAARAAERTHQEQAA